MAPGGGAFGSAAPPGGAGMMERGTLSTRALEALERAERVRVATLAARGSPAALEALERGLVAVTAEAAH